MCAVSFIGDHYGQTIPGHYPWVAPATVITQPPEVSRAEFEALRTEMAALRKLLIAAKEFDKDMGEPDCVMDEKVELLKRIAEIVGVDLSEVFGA